MANGEQFPDVDGRDIELIRLQPLNKRNINFDTNTGYRKIVASIKAIGLIEPLCVFADKDGFAILDGFLRFKACGQIGMKTVPCIIYKDKQAYTYNRNVNRLSAYQEIRMLRKSLQTLDEPTIAETFGLKSLRSRLVPNLIRQLDVSVVEAFKADKISKNVALELARVVNERQVEILKEMKKVGDYSASFCRTLIIQSTQEQRKKSAHQRKAWAEDDDRKRDLVARLARAEKQHDFYSQLYRQYSGDLLKTTFYVRKMLSVSQVEAFLVANHPEILARFRSVVEGAA